MSGLDDAYTVLGISQDATPAQVRQAYHRAVLRVHPDRAGNLADPSGFKRVQSAWESLRDSSARARYDALSKPHEATPCQDVDLDDMQVVPDDTGACRFEHPCRCGDRFAVAEESLIAGASSLVVPCCSCSASITVLYSPVNPSDDDRARMPTQAADSDETPPKR